MIIKDVKTKNMTVFAEKIKTNNLKERGHFRVSMVSIIGLGPIIAICNSFFPVYIALNIYAVVLAGFAADSWCNRFLYYNPKGIDSVIDNQLLIDVLKYHAFSVRNYFEVIRKKLWVISALSAGVSITSGIFIAYTTNEAGKLEIIYIVCGIITAVLCAVSPYIAWMIKRSCCEKRMLCEERRTGKAILLGIMVVVKYLFKYILEIVIIAFSVVFTGLISWTYLLGACDGVKINDDIIMRVAYKYSLSPIIFCIIVILIICNFTRGYLFKKKWMKLCKAVIFCVLTVAVIVSSIFEINVKTVFYEGCIKEYNFNYVKSYENSDISDFIIYDDNGSAQMKLIMKDGYEIKLITGSSTDSDAFSNAYYGDTNWFLFYIDELHNNGIKGTLNDEIIINKEMTGEDKKLVQGWEEIKNKMQ